MIRSFEVKDIQGVTRIHIEALKGDFLPSLGKSFLESLYLGLIGKKGIYGFIDEEKGKITGFILGTKNMEDFFKTALKSQFIKLSFFLFLKILKQPSLIKKVLQTFQYSSKEEGAESELVVIAIAKKWQGKGIGKKLVKALENQFFKVKVKKYKVTVYAEKSAVNFYKKLKFVRIANFNLYDKLWYIYEKKIA